MRVEFDDLMTLSDCDPGDLEDLGSSGVAPPVARHIDNWQSILGMPVAPPAPPAAPAQPRVVVKPSDASPLPKTVKGPFGLPAKIMGYPSTYVVVGIGGVVIVGLALLLKKKKKPAQPSYPAMGQYPYPYPQYYQPSPQQYYQPPAPQHYQTPAPLPASTPTSPIPAPAVASTAPSVKQNRPRKR